MARKYRAIGPLLTKMEGLVVHTNTGKSPKLARYYAYWERKVFESLTKVCDLFLFVTRRPVLYSELFFNFKKAMYILARYVYFVLYTKLEKCVMFSFFFETPCKQLF